ncbi:ABC transporter permease [Caldinitratiruptor microaerophilus]|uniref:Peptide ABC transporter n=1 Tax=Caldinitratiruptor microaerophilus TaxID=671077 RepID=A0AA35CNG5_9FIRM|nr:ABC transporter permease [Caldinitratiruptor microaerophilus]BDG61643.1 peptide ABC transporter [Caldinitratiruptor microaerophilus]
MLAYLGRRLLLTIPLLFVVSFVAFGLVHFLPGDPADVILGPEAPREVKEALRVKLGLNLPLHVQYGRWLARVVQGNLGESLVDGSPVAGLIAQRLPATLELTVLTFAVSTLIAVPLGVAAAVRRATVVDYLSSGVALVGLSVPHFWLGMMLILLFAAKLQWLPASGYVPLTQDLRANLMAMALPAMATGLRESGVVARFMRSSLLEVLRSDYVRTARAKGLSERVVIYRHAIRNALVPVITASGLQIAGLLGGLVITETIFVIPGFGRLIVDAIFSRDITVVQGAVLVAAVMVVVVNLVVDVVYSLVDPRVKLGGGGER